MFTHTLSGHWPAYLYVDIKVQLNVPRVKTFPFVIDISISTGVGQQQTKRLLTNSHNTGRYSLISETGFLHLPLSL